jgi:hypothetical protein
MGDRQAGLWSSHASRPPTRWGHIPAVRRDKTTATHRNRKPIMAQAGRAGKEG